MGWQNVFAAFFQAGNTVEINANGLVAYAGVPGFNNAVASIAQAPFTDTSGNLILEGLTSYLPSSSPATAVQLLGGTINFYTATNETTGWGSPIAEFTMPTSGVGLLFSALGNPSVEMVTDTQGQLNLILNSGNGFNGYPSLSNIDTTSFTVTAATATQLTKAWTIPASDGAAHTSYKIKVPLVGTWGSTATALTILLVFGGVNLARITIGASQFPISTAFTATLEAELTITAAGSSGSCISNIVGSASVTGTSLLAQANTANASIGVSGYLGATTINTTVGNSLELQAFWGSSTVAATVTCPLSKITREGV